jgi:hypothetical protein
MSHKSRAKAYAARNEPASSSSSSSSVVVATPIHLALQHTDVAFSERNAIAFRKKFDRFIGKNWNVRADKADRAKSITDAHGSDVLDLFGSIRQMIPFFGLSRPNMKHQSDFLEYIELLVCGNFFIKNGLITPSVWKEIYSDGPMGKSGNVGNNHWKSFTESCFRVFNILQNELINPSLFGTSPFSRYSVSSSSCTDNSRMYYADQVNSRARINSVLNIDGFQDNILVFSPTSSSTGTGSFLIDFIKLVDTCSAGMWTVGICIFINI